MYSVVLCMRGQGSQVGEMKGQVNTGRTTTDGSTGLSMLLNKENKLELCSAMSDHDGAPAERRHAFVHLCSTGFSPTARAI